MGRFEDLVAQAREGDTEALDALESEFSGSSLRQQAEAGTQAQRQLEEQAPLVREAKFTRLVNDLPEDLQSVGLTVEDVGDVDPNELTIETLSDRARSKQEAEQARLETMAESQGFESVEAFQAALEATKQTNTERTKNMEAIGSGVASGSGGSVEEPPEEPFDAMKGAHDDARQRGLPKDKAMGEGMEALLAAQAPLEE